MKDIPYEACVSEKKSREVTQECGNCKYHVFETVSMGFVCVRAGSGHCSDWTENDDSCDLWEAKNG